MHLSPWPSSLWSSESVKEEVRDSQGSRSGSRASEEGAEDAGGPRCWEKTVRSEEPRSGD